MLFRIPLTLRDLIVIGLHPHLEVFANYQHLFFWLPEIMSQKSHFVQVKYRSKNKIYHFLKFFKIPIPKSIWNTQKFSSLFREVSHGNARNYYWFLRHSLSKIFINSSLLCSCLYLSIYPEPVHFVVSFFLFFLFPLHFFSVFFMIVISFVIQSVFLPLF